MTESTWSKPYLKFLTGSFNLGGGYPITDQVVMLIIWCWTKWVASQGKAEIRHTTIWVSQQCNSYTKVLSKSILVEWGKSRLGKLGDQCKTTCLERLPGTHSWQLVPYFTGSLIEPVTKTTCLEKLHLYGQWHGLSTYSTICYQGTWRQMTVQICNYIRHLSCIFIST